MNLYIIVEGRRTEKKVYPYSEIDGLFIYVIELLIKKMKDIIMLDLVKICENIDRYDRLVMGLHGVKLEYQGGLEHVAALKKDPHQIEIIKEF